MLFLIDGHRDRVAARRRQWAAGVAGQLLTPLTKYRLGDGYAFAVDNGAFTRLDAIPDRVGDHQEPLRLYAEYHRLADGWPKAFVVQDGFTGIPRGVASLFIGGTNAFKDSAEALAIVRRYRDRKHIHVGRVNGPDRWLRFARAGAHTCDGSGVSRYDHMLPLIKSVARNALR